MQAPIPKNSVEIIPGRFYFVTQRERPADVVGRSTFCVDEALVYRGFYMDFGPLNLGMLYRYCRFLDDLLKSPDHAAKQIVHYATTEPKKRSCAATLIGAYCVIYRGMTPEEAYRPLSRLSPPLMPFRDASYGSCSYQLTVLDVLRGIGQAVLHKWLDFDTFDLAEYEHYEQVRNGDLNWHVPGKFLAFAGPHNVAHITERGYPKLAPENFFEVFKKYGVTDIIRTNKKLYDASKFTNQGFKVHELFFVDGTTPNSVILQKFLQISEAAQGAVAVHCKAGLGRTGTLIACYLMKHYMLTAAECIGWMRVCRPGTIIGPQQYFVGDKQTEMWRAGSKLGVTRKEMGSTGKGDSLAGWANRANTVLDQHMATPHATSTASTRSGSQQRRTSAGGVGAPGGQHDRRANNDDGHGADSDGADEAADVLGDLAITGRRAPSALKKGAATTSGRTNGYPSAAELMAAAATAPPGMQQGDGLNTQKTRRMMQRNVSTAELRVSAPGVYRRTGSEGQLSTNTIKTARPAPTKSVISRNKESKTVQVSVLPK
eukprot:m.82650 g.82650  ORF g.82650 m.82650 type:complete len:543 (-) comp9486_c1_seq1:195-1823(-)